MASMALSARFTITCFTSVGSALTGGSSGIDLGPEHDAAAGGLFSQQADGLVDGGGQVDVANVELGLDEHLADARDDVAGALIVPLDVLQDFSHVLQSRRVRLKEQFRRVRRC